MDLTPHQCRAARALLDWTVDRLSERARVAKETIIEFEIGQRVPQGRTLQAIQRTLEVSGIVFIPENGGGTGVRFRRRSRPVGEGSRIDELMADDDG